jgi:hypothetical protein
MADLSSMPSPGPELPSGCTNVKVRSIGPDPSAGSNKLDVTTLDDEERKYAAAPLVDVGPGADEDGVTQEVIAQFFGAAPSVDAPGSTGWVCVSVETDYSVGEFVKGTATYRYKEPAGS